MHASAKVSPEEQSESPKIYIISWYVFFNVFKPWCIPFSKIVSYKVYFMNKYASNKSMFVSFNVMLKYG